MNENRVVTAYRKYAENYDLAVKLYRLLGLKIGKYRRMSVDSLELSKGDTVVELGCGTGLNFSLVLDAIGSEGKLIGVDITDKMLDQARIRVKENGWNNVELVQSDTSDYDFPKELDGIFATGALQYSPQYDEIIKKGYDALKTGKNFVVFDFKMPKGFTRIFAPVLIFFTKAFEANEEYLKRHAWESIEKYFEKTTFQEGWGGFVYISVGEKL
jgi:demethylmenaquinone methyltransferase/2-methoxy-6-polyprenyl-1,4-benzoquinol methylase